MTKTNYYELNKKIFEKLNLPCGASVADLGCRDAGFLMSLVEAFPSEISSAVGVDINDKCFDNIEYKVPIELKVMNCGEKLEFSDNSFDFVFSKDMFECVSDKELLVSEIYRILKPGGVVICVNCDWDSVTYNGNNKALINKAIHAYAETKQPWMDDIDSWIGRRMHGIFNKSGLLRSSVDVFNVVETEYENGSFGYNMSTDIAWLYKENTGALTESEYNEFIENLKTAQEEGDYIFTKPYYIYKGIKVI